MTNKHTDIADACHVLKEAADSQKKNVLFFSNESGEYAVVFVNGTHRVDEICKCAANILSTRYVKF